VDVKPLAQREVTLTFNNATATITSNDEGMFDLNEIYRKFGLKGRRQPSDWKTGVRRHLSHTANLRVGHTNDENGYITNRTYATLEALYAYAMWVEVTLTFNNTTATITSNDEGMFDLNDIWRDYDLKASQSPSQWRNKAKAHFVLSGKLQTRKGQGGRNGATLATLEALYAYAMWVDVEFYMVVVEAFAALTRGDTERAK